VDEVVVEPEPYAASIAAIRDRASAADHVVIGTIDVLAAVIAGEAFAPGRPPVRLSVPA
jgi:hypothetical protein